MKKGEILTGVVEYTGFPNKGTLHIDGQKIKVKGVLPGQKISFSVKKTGQDKAEGILREVIEPGLEETEVPPCPHFGVCGGCTLQTMPYLAQLALKEKHIKDLLQPVLAGESCEWMPIKGSPQQYEYRNKMEFSFGDEYKDGPLALGLHKKGSFYDLVTTTGCQIMHEDMRKVLAETLRFATENNLSYYHKMKKTGYLRHLLVRRAVKTGELLIALVTTTQQQANLQEWAERMQRLELTGTIAGILHTENDSESDAICDQGTTLLAGRDYFYEELLGLRFQIRPFSFFQTNSLGAEVLYDSVREMVGETKGVLFDLYSGTGTIGQLLSPVAEKVIGVELVEEAVLAARENASMNGLANCEFLAGDVLKMLDVIETRPDYIILDPPREGIMPKALKKILAYGVESMVYISCKPTSLARDLPEFLAAGYHVKKVQCVDMFPQTPHVETVVLMSRKDK